MTAEEREKSLKTHHRKTECTNGNGAVSPGLRKLRWEDGEVEASLGYVASSRLVYVVRPGFQKQNKTKQENRRYMVTP